MIEYCYSKMISVVVLNYNSSLESIYCTLESLIRQKDASFEIIIADDGSDKQFFKEIREYFNSKKFLDYKIIEHVENVGTVRNFLRALEYTQGKYIKGLGSGDCLYNAYTLHEIVEYSENENVKIAFGNLQGFRKTSQTTIDEVSWFTPKDILPYIKDNRKQIVKNMVIYEDYISGASLFFNRKYFYDKLREIESIVTYCEDLIQVLAILEGEKINFFDRIIVYYEVGTGISTNKVAGKINPRMLKDHQRFNEYLLENYNNKVIRDRVKRKNKVINNDLVKIYYGLKNLSYYMRKTVYLFLKSRRKEDMLFLEEIFSDVALEIARV